MTLCSAEVEQVALAHLNELVTRKRFVDDGKCLYCGIRARVQNLCVSCEDRRQRLSEKYPGNSIQRVQAQVEAGPTRLRDIQKPVFRNPHNSE